MYKVCPFICAEAGSKSLHQTSCNKIWFRVQGFEVVFIMFLKQKNQNSWPFCIWIWISCIFHSFQTKLMGAAVTHISNHTTLKKYPSRLSAWARGQTASPVNSIPPSLDECYHFLYFSFIWLYPRGSTEAHFKPDHNCDPFFLWNSENEHYELISDCITL